MLKGEGAETTDSTQDMSRGVEEQKKLFEKMTKGKKAKGDLTTTDFAAGNRHVVT